MHASPQPGRLVSFTLADVPLKIRRHAGAALIRVAADDAKLLEAVQFKRAIEQPSATVYRVSEQAWNAVLGGG